MTGNLIKNYFDDGRKREALNALTRETYGFDFRKWYQGGYYTGEYIPYSIELDGNIISNASANIMKFAQKDTDGEWLERTYIQIGTVMTTPEHRRKGLAGSLIREIVKDYQDKCDGIYLFANLSALDFYKELGFWNGRQYRTFVKKDAKIEKRKSDFIRIEKDEERCRQYMATVRNGAHSSALEQTNKFGLQMFYTGGFENVYYSESLDCFVSYECEKDTLFLDSIISDKEIPIEEVLARMPGGFDKMIIEFTPKERELTLFRFEPYDGAEDYRLFCMGNTLKEIEEKKLYFPTYSHA